MITAFGNNFGAGTITFKDYQKNGVVVLNGSFTVDPSNQQYQQAEKLIISVPAMSIERSAYTSVIMAIGSGDHPQAIIVKSWISHPSTICIERLRKYESLGMPFTFIFCCAYVARAEHEQIVASNQENTWATSENNYMLIPGLHHGYYENLLFLFGVANTQPAQCEAYQEGTPIVFSQFLNFPGNAVVDVPLFQSQWLGEKKSYLYWGHVREGKFIIDPVSREIMANSHTSTFNFSAILITD